MGGDRRSRIDDVTYPGCMGGMALCICGCMLLVAGGEPALVTSGARFLGCLSSSDCPSSSHHSLSWPADEQVSMLSQARGDTGSTQWGGVYRWQRAE